MDFHSMKRKQLQALCKKHKIPANLSNLEMANRLTNFLQEENVSEIESLGEVVNKKGKKVRFSPEHELIEFTRSPELMKRRSRRKSVSLRDSNWSIEVVESAEMNEETVGRQGTNMQTGELNLMEAEVKQKKRGRKAIKCNNGQKIASAVDSFENGEMDMEEGDVVRSGRMPRLRGKTAAEGVNNASKRERKGAKGGYKRDEKASDNVKNDEHQEIVEERSRVTRSRAQNLTEAPAAEEKRGRKVVKNIGKVAAVRAETGDNRDSLSKREDDGEGKLATGSDERIAAEHVTVEPQLLLRRSKRKANGVGESEMFTCDTRKHENGKVKDSTKTSKLLASGVPEVDTEISGVEGNPGRRAVLKIEEPKQKLEPRRSNRRKTMIESVCLRGDTLRRSLPQSDIVPEVSKDENMVIQPIGVMRRSRRNTLSLKLVSASDTDSAVGNLDAEKHISESCLVEKEMYAVQTNARLTRNTSKCKPPGSLDKIGGDSNIHKKNNVMKRKRGHVTGDAIKNNNDLISGEQSLKGSSSEKVVSPAAKGKFADEWNQPYRLDNPKMLDASSHHDSSGIGESLFLDVQLSVSKDSESTNNSCSKNIITDVDLTSIKETHKKKEEVSVADSADSSCMNLANGGKLVNSDTNEASTSKNADRGIESSASEDQICTSKTLEVVEKGKLLLEFDVQESVEQNITDVDKNDTEAQVYSQAEDSGCNKKINDQVLAEGLNVMGGECSAETRSSADSFLLGDQTDDKTDLEVAETEVDESIQPCLKVVDHHNDLDHLRASSNIPDNNNEETSQTSGEDGAFESCGTDCTRSKSTSKPTLPSLGMTMHHGDDVAEGHEDSGCNKKINDQVLAEGLNVMGEEGSAETRSSADSFLIGDQTDDKTDLEVAETEVDESIQPCLKVVDHHNDLDHLGASSNIPDNNNEETSQTSGEDGAFESCGTNCTRSKSTSKPTVPSLGMTMHHGDNVAEGHEPFSHKGRASELTEADESGCLKDQRNASDHFGESKPFFPDEYSVMDSDEHCTDGNCVNLKRGHEDIQVTKNDERNIYEGINSDVAETRESESTKDHKCKCDEDGEFNLAKLFDEEGRYGITPHKKENISGEHSVKDFNEQGMSRGSPSIAPTTMCNSTGDHKANLSAEGGKVNHFDNKQSELTEADESRCLKSHKNSNSQEPNPPTPSSVSKTQAEKQKSVLAKSNALAHTNQRQGTLSNASELAGNIVCFLKSSEGKNSQIAEGLIPDEDVNHENYGIDKEVSTISDVKSCPVSKIEAESLGDMKFQDTMETEHQHRNLVARQTESDEEASLAISRQSWTEAELQNLFGTSEEDAPHVLSEIFCQGSETENMTMSKNKSAACNSGISTKKQEKEMEGESGIESDADIYEDELKFLFATPVKITTPCKTEETNSHDRVLEGSVTSIKECSDAMKENVATRSTSNEKAQHAGYVFENNLGCRASSSDNGRDDICEDMNEVESFELLNTSTGVISGAEYDGCEALEDQLTHSKEDCLQETNPITEEDREEHVMSLAESYLNDEATEKSIISSSGSPRDLHERESCVHMSEIRSCKSKAHNKSEGEMTQSTISELSDAADLQKSDVPENSHLPAACSNDGDILTETSNEASSDPEVAKTGSSKKGISPLLSLKASPDCEESMSESDNQYETKKLDEKVGNPRSSQDISDELHTNSEVAVRESVSIGYNICGELDQLVSSDELDSTCKEAKGMETTTQTLNNTDAAAEQGSFVCKAVSGLLSNSAMDISLGYHGNGDKKLEAGETVFSLDEQNVQDAGFELGNSLCNIGDILSDDGGEDTCGKMNDDESAGLEVISTKVLSNAEYDGCEASEEQLTENTAECQKGTYFIAEENEEIGQSSLYDGETENGSESKEENIISLSGTSNNLDKLGGCQDMLVDNVVSESISCKSRVDYKSEQEMIQSVEAAVELSDADLQKSNISKNSQSVIDKGTHPLLSSKASPVDDELTQSTNTDDLNGSKICDEIDTKAKSSQEMSNESHINSEVAILKGLSDSNNQSEEAGLTCGLELESSFLESKETGATTQDPNDVVAPTDHGSSVCGVELHLLLRDEKNDMENLDMGKPVFNLSGDIEKDSERAEENPTAQMVQFPIHELHFEENVEDSKNDAHTISNLPASEILRESDVADTIKEYIDSESSLPVIFENSGASLPSDMLADTDVRVAREKSASPIYKDIAARLDCLPTMKISCHSNSKGEDNVPSVDCLNTEIIEQEEATLSTRPAQVTGNAANSPERVDEEGTTVKLEADEDPITACSTVRKNSRTILIHGTPGKLLAMADMKENMPNQKRSNMGDITAVRPAKRRPLKALQLK